MGTRFYSNDASHPVYELDGDQILGYVLPGDLGGYSAAVAVGHHLYFARTLDDDAVILRIDRDDIDG